MAKFKTHSVFLSAGILIGVLLLGAFRLGTLPAEEVTHFHANFAMFINGQRVDLTDDKYMEDVQGCKPEYIKIKPEERTHMHNSNMDVVHVHDDGVTWGHFLANIGFAAGNNFVATDEDRVYVNNGSRTVKYILNGVQVANPLNKLIVSEDRLLISFGYETVAQLMNTQYPAVASDAHEHNEHPDPGSCSGTQELGFKDRLRKAFWH